MQCSEVIISKVINAYATISILAHIEAQIIQSSEVNPLKGYTPRNQMSFSRNGTYMYIKVGVTIMFMMT